MWFNWNFIEICSQQWNWQWASIGSDNSLAPNWRQAIIRTNRGRIYWRMSASLGLNGLRHCSLLSNFSFFSNGPHELKVKFQTNLKKHLMKYIWIYHVLFKIRCCNSGESSFGSNVTNFANQMTLFVRRHRWSNMTSKACLIKCGMKLLLHSQTLTVAPLKVGVNENNHRTLYNGCNC